MENQHGVAEDGHNDDIYDADGNDVSVRPDVVDEARDGIEKTKGGEYKCVTCGPTIYMVLSRCMLVSNCTRKALLSRMVRMVLRPAVQHAFIHTASLDWDINILTRCTEDNLIGSRIFAACKIGIIND